MRDWDPQQLASAARADLLSPPGSGPGPEGATIDSRQVGPGTLFVGLPGVSAHGGQFAAAALAAGAYGILTDPEHARAVLRDAQRTGGAVLAAPDPLAALQRLATAWRLHIGAHVIGVTGSTGKTSTKDLLLGVISPHRRTMASRANFNTEIGLPLEILAAPAETQVLILEMGMRGPGQIAELGAIARPDVGIIVSLGPVHLELLGSMEAIAAAKAELIAALPGGGTAIVPADEPLLAPHLRDDVRTVTSSCEMREPMRWRSTRPAARSGCRSTSPRPICGETSWPRWLPRRPSASRRRGELSWRFRRGEVSRPPFPAG